MSDLARMLDAIALQSRGNRYWVYELLDPACGPRGTAMQATPIYVGQTSNPVRRIKNHLRLADHRNPRLPLHCHLGRMIESGYLPVVHLVHAASTRLDALQAEAERARELTSRGHRLYNGWREHNPHTALRSFADTGVPESRVWSLPVAEAVESGIGISVLCRSCAQSFSLEPSMLSRLTARMTRLSEIRTVLRCPSCGKAPNFQLRKSE